MLTTIGKVKQYLEISDNAEDTILTSLADRVSAFVETYCNRVFASTDYDELYDGNSNRSLVVMNYPITSFTTLEIADLAVVSGDYFWYDYGEIILNKGTFGSKRQSVHCIYTAGFATIPLDIEDVVIKLVAMAFFGKGKDRLGVSSKTLGSEGSITFTKSKLPTEVELVLDAYKQIPVGSNRAK